MYYIDQEPEFRISTFSLVSVGDLLLVDPTSVCVIVNPGRQVVLLTLGAHARGLR